MGYTSTVPEATGSLQDEIETVIPPDLLEVVLRALGASEEWIEIHRLKWAYLSG